MVLINIDALSDSELRYIAQQEDLDNWQTLSREELIEELEDIYGDDIPEKENSDHKFIQTIVSTSSDVLDFPGISDIPENFSKSDIHFLAVDYNWAYAFWNICPQKLQELENNNADILLRITAKSSTINETYDISVSLSDRNWSIELPWKGTEYFISLIASNNGTEEIIQTSNTIYIEKPFFSEHPEVLFNQDKYKLLVSSMTTKEGQVIENSEVRRILDDIKESKK